MDMDKAAIQLENIRLGQARTNNLTEKVLETVKKYIVDNSFVTNEWAENLLKQYLAERNQRHAVANGWKAKEIFQAIYLVERNYKPQINSITVRDSQTPKAKKVQKQFTPWSERTTSGSVNWAKCTASGNDFISTAVGGKNKKANGKK